MLVEKNDVIEFYKEPKETTVIKWQQNFQDRQEVFLVIPYTVKGKEASGTLFVEQKKAKEFMDLAKKTATDEDALFDTPAFTTEVTEDFQYGQDADKTMRFLVYHDKSENMFQHRFVSTSAFQNIATKVGEKAGQIDAVKGYLDKIMKLGKAYIGDPLRSF